VETRSTTRVGADAGGVYAVLGVAESAGARELTRAYWRQARRLHPDVNAAPDAAERFAVLSRAYRSALRASSRRAESAGAEPSGAEPPGAVSSGLVRVNRSPQSPSPRGPHDDVWLLAGPVRVTPLRAGVMPRRHEGRS
jgi:hypothetical protein